MRKWMTILGILVCLTGCTKPAPPAATPMTLEAADNQANNGKQVSIEGYARLPVMGTISDTMLIDLRETPDEKSRSMSFEIPIGSGANSLEEPPKDYKDSDMKLHLADGSLVSLTDKVRVSGELTWMDAGQGKHSAWISKPYLEKVAK